jgi:hypothetical protein
MYGVTCSATNQLFMKANGNLFRLGETLGHKGEAFRHI